MKRFQTEKSRRFPSGVFSILLFFCILFVLYTAVQTFSRRSLEEQEQNLIQALRQSTIQCYATEGFYPESVGYLEEYYGIQYDHNRFFVDYQPVGRNIMPEITVICKKEGWYR